MQENKIDRSYKYVENTTSFSYRMAEIDKFKINVNILNNLIKKGVKIDSIVAIRSSDFGEYSRDFCYETIEDFVESIDTLRNKKISKVVDYCSENGVKFEVHVMPEFSKIAVIFRNHKREDDKSVDKLIEESIKVR